MGERGDYKRVVGALPIVDVVIGVDRFLGAHHSTQHLDASIGDDFVDIHVGLGATASLPHHQGEVIVQLPVNHLLRCRLDSLPQFGIQVSHLGVDGCCCTLQDCGPPTIWTTCTLT